MEPSKIPPSKKSTTTTSGVEKGFQRRSVSKARSPGPKGKKGRRGQITQKKYILQPPSPEMKKELEENVKALENMYPKSGFNFNVLLENLINSPEERQKEFIKNIQEHLAAKQAEPKGWLTWAGSLVTRLKDRAVSKYQYGVENMNHLAQIFKDYAEIGTFFTSVVAGRVVEGIEENYITGGILQLANQSIKSVGDIALSTATMTVPFLTEWGVRLAAVITGTHDPEHPEETTEAAMQLRQSVENYLNATAISERSIQDLTTLVVTNMYSWVVTDFWGQYSPMALLEAQGDITSLLSKIVKKGSTILPELLILHILSDAFGPQAHPLHYLDPSLFLPGQLTALQINILTSCIVTILRTGTLPVRETLIKFILGGPGSIKALGIKKLISKTRGMVVKKISAGTHPMFEPVFMYFAIKASKALLIRPTKKVMKTAVEKTINLTTEKGKKLLIKEEDEKEKTLPEPIQVPAKPQIGRKKTSFMRGKAGKPK